MSSGSLCESGPLAVAECDAAADLECRAFQDIARFAQQDTLPKPDGLTERTRIERMGVQIGDRIDAVLVKATLPPGWSKVLEVPSRSAWLRVCHLLDERARLRAELMHQSATAHVRRQASLRLLTRYRVDGIYFDSEGNRVPHFTSDLQMLSVLDGEDIIHHAPLRHRSKWTPTQDKDFKAVYGWIRVHLPRLEDPLAYWDDL